MILLTRAVFYALFIFMLFGNIKIAWSSESDFDRATALYNNDNYAESERIFSRLPGYRARMAYALSVYYQSNIMKSKFIFLTSVLLADTDKQRFTSLYNAASCAFISGQYAEAVKLYNDALGYNKQHKSTTNLLALSQRMSKLVLSELDKRSIKQNSKRSGSGKISIKLEESMFDREASISMEDITEADSEKSQIINEQQTDSEVVELLLEKGINAISLNAASDLSLPDDQYIAPATTATLSDEHTPLMATDELWQRVFELEYNIPSALENKQRVPGYRQW